LSVLSSYLQLAALKAAQRRTNAYPKAIAQAEAALNKRAKRRKR